MNVNRRSAFGGMVMVYGCPTTPDIPPEDWLPPAPVPPTLPMNPGLEEMLERMRKSLNPCAKCSRHVRPGEPCPWCVRDELDALKKAIGVDAKPAETIAALRVALRKSLGALRDVSRTTGGGLEPLIAELEKALDA